jgi:small-conductance mechanosensitive channel
MDLFGIRLVGLNDQNAQKLALTVGLVVGLMLCTAILHRLLRLAPATERATRVRFWSRQAVGLTVALIGAIGLASIWFDNPRTLSTAAGLMSAGLAFALQKVITSFAGYFLILRGNNFSVGDRIVMGGVRGNVIALGFFQTTIMEMGQPAAVQNADPAMWVKSRQFTGRIVTVANSRIFDDPVYNYTRDFPFIWEELSLPIAYRDDRQRVERILLDTGRRHAADPKQLAPGALERLYRKYDVSVHDFEPRVYWRLTDNWVELTVRLLVPDRGTRDIKDAMSREVIAALDEAGIGIASATSEIVGFPTLNVQQVGPAPPREPA